MTENKGGIPEQLPLAPIYKVETSEEREERLRDDQGFYRGEGKQLKPIEPTVRPYPSNEELTRSYWDNIHDPRIQRDRDKRGPRKRRVKP